MTVDLYRNPPRDIRYTHTLTPTTDLPAHTTYSLYQTLTESPLLSIIRSARSHFILLPLETENVHLATSHTAQSQHRDQWNYFCNAQIHEGIPHATFQKKYQICKRILVVHFGRILDFLFSSQRYTIVYLENK